MTVQYTWQQSPWSVHGIARFYCQWKGWTITVGRNATENLADQLTECVIVASLARMRSVLESTS